MKLYFFSDGNLRLVGDLSPQNLSSSGRLEIYLQGEWGTVCTDRFGKEEADVACRQLGFTGFNRFGNTHELG